MLKACVIVMAMMIGAPAMAQTPDAQAGTQSGEATSPGASLTAIVETEFPVYDQNQDGQLDKSEFSRWMLALKDQEMKATGQKLAPADITAWVNGAFATADADRNAAVSKAELITYLSGSAG